MERKRVEAWAVFNGDIYWCSWLTKREAEASVRLMSPATKARIVHLVPANPAMDRLVKAAMRWAEAGVRQTADPMLRSAVEAYRLAQKKERKP
jgi:hypothetical protein